jgi:hypothetical protein
MIPFSRGDYSAAEEMAFTRVPFNKERSKGERSPFETAILRREKSYVFVIDIIY